MAKMRISYDAISYDFKFLSIPASLVLSVGFDELIAEGAYKTTKRGGDLAKRRSGDVKAAWTF